MAKFKSHALFEYKSRQAKANKIIKTLIREGARNGENLLEIGTGSGIIALELSKKFKVTSVDIVDERVIRGFNFKLVKGTKLPFKDNSFSIIVSNQVIEHVNNQAEHIKEIHRCLKNGGICYLATPNKWAVFETHYRIPFLSWMPKTIANRYLRLIKKCEYDVNPLSFKMLIRLCKKEHFEIKHLTFEVIRSPSFYGLDSKYLFLSKFTKLIPRKLDWLVGYNLPCLIFILRKKL